MLLTLLFIAGCASFLPVRNPVRERIIDKPYDVVWNRAIESLPRPGGLVIRKDREKGLIVINRYIQGHHVPFGGLSRSWYYGKIRVNIFINRISAEETKVFVDINILKLRDLSWERLDIQRYARILREYMLFNNFSTEKHYLDYIEKAVRQEKPLGMHGRGDKK